MTRYSTPFRRGDDPIVWLRCELPTWPVHLGPEGLYHAESPTRHIDGITISAPDPEELVERVRAFERMIALAAGRAGTVPIGRPIGGQPVDRAPARDSAPRKPSAAPRTSPADPDALSDPTALGPAEGRAAVERARSRGYSGTPCSSCGSLHTRYSGICLVCDNCGSTSGCS